MRLKKYFALATVALAPVFAYGDLHLKDFEGKFVVSGQTPGSFTIGGEQALLNGNTTFGSGFLAQVHIDKHGNGLIHFLSQTLFFGPSFPASPGVTANAFINRTATGAVVTPFGTTKPDTSFTVTITDKEKGIGRIVMNDTPFAGTNTTADFIAFQDKKTGKVTKYVQHSVEVGDTALNAGLLTAERQTTN